MPSNSKPSPNLTALHADVRRLLKKYKCPMQLHQVRARFMGAIASPVEAISPMKEISALWGGKMPNMKDRNAVNELMQTFAMDLWNSLAVHSYLDKPFKLTATKKVQEMPELISWAQIKRDEVEGFVIGFFQESESLKLSMELCESLDVLEDLVGMFAGVANMSEDTPDSDLTSVSSVMQQMKRLAEIAEIEINSIIRNSHSLRNPDRDTTPHSLH